MVRLLHDVLSGVEIPTVRHPSQALVRCGLLSLVAMSLASLATTTVVVDSRVEQRAMARQGSNILVIERVLRDLGPIHLDGKHLLAGNTILDGDESFVDEMSAMLGGQVTVFHGDLRVATTLRRDGQRAVGTHLARGPVYMALFKRGERYRGLTNVLSVDTYAAYDPLRGTDGQVIGAVFIGLPRRQFHNAVAAAQASIGLTSLVVLIFASLAFSANARPLKREIDSRELHLQQLADRMRHLALHDPLTNLANRIAFTAALEQQLEEPAACFAVFMIDLDRFKEINDLYGHSVGDALLCEIAARLARQVASSSTCARLGGDEFALLIRNVREAEILTKVAQGILDTFSEPINFQGISIQSRASIGVTSISNSLLTPDEVLSQADLALYTAKARGRGVYDLFTPALAVALQNRHDLKCQMLEALDEGGFVLHYQPQYSVTTGELVGFEALVRWQHPSRGLLYPKAFIAEAEESGLIARLGGWVIEQACRDASAWGGDVRVAVNVSAVQFAKPTFVADTMTAASRAGLRLEMLELEVTETVLLEDTPEIIDALRKLRCAGVRVALDDFGTGYSSLLYLRRLPFDVIKIDQAFVRDLGCWREAASIAGIIIQLAQSFGAMTIAEGVEQEGQLAELRALGCDMAQGFHLSRPVPFEVALAAVTDQTRTRQNQAASAPLLLATQ